MKIRVLPDLLINKISAGEVVERPAAVVRELVDNAIDAGATEVRVWIEEGGQALMRVLDNGCGMVRDDALLSLERHATSKIGAEDDLNSISTMGFRGEALPSIAAVSRMRLLSRTAETGVGTEITLAGGKIERVAERAAPQGTDIEVRSLFFNTPARKKFLKQPKTEEARVKVWLKQSAIANPTVHYRLCVDGKECLNLPPKSGSLDRAKAMYQGAVVEFSEDLEGLRIEGLVAHPALAQGDGNSFVVLINRRLVGDKMILRAVKDGFDSTLKEREFPLGFVSLQLPPHLVDVNVHPQKSEVRFAAPQSIFLLVRSAVRNAVVRFTAPIVPLERQGGSFAVRDVPRPHYQAPTYPASSAAPTLFSADWPGAAAALEQPAAPPADPSFRYSNLRYVGQVLACYLLTEWNEAMYVIDMHAAHERCNYNRVRRAYDEKQVNAQGLIVPLKLTLGEEALANLLSQRDLLERFGFAFAPEGETAVRIDAVPALLVDRDVTGLIREIAASFEAARAVELVSQRVDAISARIACHGSIRSGKILEREEAYALFHDLDQSEFSGACPHGRPVIARFSADQIERWFGRDR